MKRFMWASPILLLVISVSAFADSVTMNLFPSDLDDNFSFFEQGNGFQVTFSGGIQFGNGFFDPRYAPGATVGGLTDVFTANVLIKINGVSYDVESFSFGPELFIFPFTLPTNGKDFTINTEAFFGFSGITSNGQTFDVFGAAPGKMRFTFGGGIYTAQPLRFSTVPEPSTLGLLATGLTGIFALARSKRSNRSLSRV